ncbi:hypothetical protein GARC_4470 [Paraglaciecola arctica BSs20135]|uniref:Uncharacterized protein n=1 Tax=Paraglaciecola arctica BSs20135 TaxID=493475 RepID=K6YTD2_9ALTE|nr:hypothetical protein GARC_4470 [Paraglaciecola arctica BSs20135]
MRLRLLPSMAFFSQNPFCAIYFLPTAAKSKQKGPLAKLGSSSNYF